VFSLEQVKCVAPELENCEASFLVIYNSSRPSRKSCVQADRYGMMISVVDPKLLFSDPDPALGLISDPDPACLTKVIRLYLICPQESIAQRFSSHFRR
jgi:hypothetical protein